MSGFSENNFKTQDKQEKDSYGNEVSRLARPLPVEYLLVDVPASTPVTPHYTFNSDPTKQPFPVENRLVDGHIQDFNALSTYLTQFAFDEFYTAIYQNIGLQLNNSLPQVLHLLRGLEVFLPEVSLLHQALHLDQSGLVLFALSSTMLRIPTVKCAICRGPADLIRMKERKWITADEKILFYENA
ncbi:hypothetical protein JTB14_010957 [Gonioctena quinquepunctata]|nr:hypothetical protein JTB14_010957 [Gonioctena quinquepunctata]